MGQCYFCMIEGIVEDLENKIRVIDNKGEAALLDHEYQNRLWELYNLEPCEHKKARDAEAIRNKVTSE